METVINESIIFIFIFIGSKKMKMYRSVEPWSL